MNYYLGIDVSKGYADFVIINDKKKTVLESFQLDDTFDGHSCLCSELSRFVVENNDTKIYAAVESTGGYENNWFDLLIRLQNSLPIQAARLNPLGVHANSKASLQNIITDQISAKNIAEYLVAHPEKVTYQVPDGKFTSAKKLWKFIQMLNKQKTQLLNHLELHVYSANPELLHFCVHGVPLWIIKLLKKYPTAKKLSKAQVKSVAAIPYVSEDKAKKVIEAAKKSIASASDELTEKTIITVVNQVISLSITIKEQHKILADNFSTPEAELLASIPGVGIESAIGMMIEIENIERFPLSKKISAFFGLHPVFKESGDKGSGYRMSKKGRKAPRGILYMVTLSAIQRNPIIKEIYVERTSKGMEKMAAIGLCMHKLLRIMYGMLKNNTKFDAEIDRQNRKDKQLNKSSSKRKDKKRRFQKYDSKAPTSGRQYKKRKEQTQATSQNQKNG
jgi:transposase